MAGVAPAARPPATQPSSSSSSSPSSKENARRNGEQGFASMQPGSDSSSSNGALGQRGSGGEGAGGKALPGRGKPSEALQSARSLHRVTPMPGQLAYPLGSAKRSMPPRDSLGAVSENGTGYATPDSEEYDAVGPLSSEEGAGGGGFAAAAAGAGRTPLLSSSSSSNGDSGPSHAEEGQQQGGGQQGGLPQAAGAPSGAAGGDRRRIHSDPGWPTPNGPAGAQGTPSQNGLSAPAEEAGVRRPSPRGGRSWLFGGLGRGSPRGSSQGASTPRHPLGGEAEEEPGTAERGGPQGPPRGRSTSDSSELLLPKQPGQVLARMAADAAAGAPTPLRISIDRGCSRALSTTGPLPVPPAALEGVAAQAPGPGSEQWQEDERAVARFLRTTPGLSKQVIGNLLGEPSERSLRVLEAFTRLFSFKGMSFETAMRTYLESFRLPGEAQKIYRILDAWSQEYFAQSPGIFASADAVHVLAFSVVLLNTDQHKNAVKRKMTCEEFVRNNRGINAGASLPDAFLAGLYEGIRHHAIPIPSAASHFPPGGRAKGGSGYFPPPATGPPRRPPPRSQLPGALRRSSPSDSQQPRKQSCFGWRCFGGGTQ